jgi:6-phosphogluconolactonase
LVVLTANWTFELPARALILSHMQEPFIQVVADADAMAATAAERIIQLADAAIAARQVFSIALSGGNTPKTLFELLASPAYVRRVSWQSWEIYFSDERCVPPDDPQSNYRMARLAMLDRVPISPTNVHRMPGEIEPQQAATQYGQLLKDKFGEGGLDVILLGMGDDGHTASLFPGTAALNETHHRCVANFVPQLKTWRLTMTAPFINRAAEVMILVAGAAKAQRLAEVLEGPRDPQRLPIQLIQPNPGRLLWIMDRAAAGMDKLD